MFNVAQGGANMATSILRLPAVRARTGLSRSTVYLRVAEGTFPKPVSLGARAVGWIESEVQQWLEQRIEASRKPAA
jgi:prophage regulatory protein